MTDEVIKPFLFEGEITVRGFLRNGVPWFVAIDVCRALGLTNSTKAVSALDDEERSTLTLSAGGPDRLIVSESGMFTMILRSDSAIKPGTTAHKFKAWVTAEVLPAIRAEGRYELAKAEALPPPPSNHLPDMAKMRLVELTRRVFGRRVAAEVYYTQGLPITPSMYLPPSQMDLMVWGTGG